MTQPSPNVAVLMKDRNDLDGTDADVAGTLDDLASFMGHNSASDTHLRAAYAPLLEHPTQSEVFGNPLHRD